jgi:hypothetical protein
MSTPIPPTEDPELLAGALARTPDCLPLETLAAAALGELAEPERGRVLAHAERCPACGAELALARAFAAPVTAAEADAVERVVARLGGGAGRVLAFPAARAARPAAVGWTRWAMAALLLLGIGLAFQATRSALPPELGEPGAGDVLRGGPIEALAPLGELAQAPAELRWRPVAGASRYRVELLDVGGEALGGGETATATYELTAMEQALLRPRASYAWRVVAFSPTGAELARSPVIEFALAPTP